MPVPENVHSEDDFNQIMPKASINVSSTESVSSTSLRKRKNEGSPLVSTTLNSDVSSTQTTIITTTLLKATPPLTSKEDSTELNQEKEKNAFKARTSSLDFDRLKNDRDPFLGFFVLFWMTMSLHTIHTFVKNFQSKGTLVGLTMLPHLTSNFFSFLTMEVGMVCSLILAWVWTRLLVNVLSLSRPMTFIFQHMCQLLFLISWLTVAWHAQWSWIQTAVFTLHTINMYFKIHSYNEINASYLQLYRTDPTSSLLTVGDTTFPKNLTFSNFILYLSMPTLVYALEYPRTPHFRSSYFLKKMLGLIGILFLLYSTIEHSITPVLTNMSQLSFLETLVELWFPFMTCYLLFFFIVFDCICNAFAEITRFADRHFYDDWWNSTSFDQFARKWNRPVHTFLRRHVYLESIQTHRMPKQFASYLTFFYSSVLHELVMVMISKRVLFYLFVLQMTQLPLIWLSKSKWIQQNPILANAFFWFSMFSGPPLLAILYCRAVFIV